MGFLKDMGKMVRDTVRETVKVSEEVTHDPEGFGRRIVNEEHARASPSNLIERAGRYREELRQREQSGDHLSAAVARGKVEEAERLLDEKLRKK